MTSQKLKINTIDFCTERATVRNNPVKTSTNKLQQVTAYYRYTELTRISINDKNWGKQPRPVQNFGEKNSYFLILLGPFVLARPF